MRSSGAVSSLRGLGPHDHVCWTYDHDDEFRALACEFLEDGLAAGQRVALVGEGDVKALRAQLDALPDVEEHLARGALQLDAASDVYPHGGAIDANDPVAAYEAATVTATADGFTGFRAAVEATSLARTPAHLDAFLRYEQAVDRLMARRPFSALCAYRVGDVGTRAAADLACVHPLYREGSTPFFLAATEGFDALLGGELDVAAVDAFPRALEHADLACGGHDIVIDASPLSFVDHRALLALEQYARRRRADVVLYAAGGMAARLVDILGLERVSVA